MRTRGYVIGVAIVVVVALGITFFAVNSRNEPPPPVRPDTSVTASFVSPNLVGYKQGVRQWSLKADAITELPGESGSEVQLDRIREGWMYKDGKPDVHFTAAEGVWTKARNELVLTGDVVVETASQRFRADRLTADMNGEHMHLQGHVQWHDQTSQIRADEAFYNSVADTIEFIGVDDWAVFTQKD